MTTLLYYLLYYVKSKFICDVFRKAYKLEASANISNVLIGGKIDKVDIDDVQIEFAELELGSFENKIHTEDNIKDTSTIMKPGRDLSEYFDNKTKPERKPKKGSSSYLHNLERKRKPVQDISFQILRMALPDEIQNQNLQANSYDPAEYLLVL
ncbi:hypothetical protein RCL_jg28827.t1 [Rhizophagus clarus]|uniref:Uncharacterized protein n=1 Tax=Rhizophagus clarus TaxID=94130 RepID=A0A8H3QTT9_9GLOM|nr:hypothetical protein RCL_jg28827.t1 [Rhizophagus clarus]